jgi:hypothetical protein
VVEVQDAGFWVEVLLRALRGGFGRVCGRFAAGWGKAGSSPMGLGTRALRRARSPILPLNCHIHQNPLIGELVLQSKRMSGRFGIASQLQIHNFYRSWLPRRKHSRHSCKRVSGIGIRNTRVQLSLNLLELPLSEQIYALSDKGFVFYRRHSLHNGGSIAATERQTKCDAY